MKLKELHKRTIPNSIKDILGTKVGKLTILSYEGRCNKNRYYVRVKCDCGVEKIINAYGILSGTKTKSCGCATQHNNRKNSFWIEYNDKKLTASQWGREIGVSGGVIRERARRGWDVEDIFTIPVQSKNKVA